MRLDEDSVDVVFFFRRGLRGANVAKTHPHEARLVFFSRDVKTTPPDSDSPPPPSPNRKEGPPNPGNHASVWHVSQNARPVCFLGAISGQRLRATRNARRQDRGDVGAPRFGNSSKFRSVLAFLSFVEGRVAAAKHRVSPKAASASARHRSADSARARHSRETQAARASACGCRRSSTRPRTSPGRSRTVALFCARALSHRAK